MNETYVPYQQKGEWFYTDFRDCAHGPFISEEVCRTWADKALEKYEVMGR